MKGLSSRIRAYCRDGCFQEVEVHCQDTAGWPAHWDMARDTWLCTQGHTVCHLMVSCGCRLLVFCMHLAEDCCFAFMHHLNALLASSTVVLQFSMQQLVVPLGPHSDLQLTTVMRHLAFICRCECLVVLAGKQYDALCYMLKPPEGMA